MDFIIERGDRVALVGVNGAGKSTLIKILAGAEPVSAGEYMLGHNVEPDYFAQDQYKELDQNARMLDDLATVAPRATNTELRSMLGCFLFSEDDVFKQIGVLSGGERNRYALARMLMQPSNFMLLDEPTNHLDMRAKDVLLGRCRITPARWCSSRTTATSSTSWRRASSKWRRGGCTCFPAITRIICGGRREADRSPAAKPAARTARRQMTGFRLPLTLPATVVSAGPFTAKGGRPRG